MKKNKKFGLATWIIIGMVLGIITGLFFGEWCAKLKIIGDVFIQLLQMTILPYIITSLIVGIGGLSFKEARNLALRGGVLLLIFWCVIVGTIFLMPMIFPVTDSASFFSSNMVKEIPPPNYLELYIPSNPFKSMAASMIPAVVLFSLCLGVALIGIKEKTSLLNALDIVKNALMRLARAVVYLTPIGVFAFAANAAGTLTIEQFTQLQVFFVTYISVTVILTFVMFPFMVSIFTPFTMRQVISTSKDVLVTAFTTGNLFIVLPMISSRVKSVLETAHDNNEENQNLPDVIIPVTFNFPDAGQLSFILFILFASWFAGNIIPVSRYFDLAFTGILSFFGGANLAIPYLLNYFKLSVDYFQLYMVAGIINGYFATMAASMQLICFTIICAVWMSGRLRFSLKRLLINGSIAFAIILAILFSANIYLGKTAKSVVSQKNVLDGMKIKNPVEFVVITNYDYAASAEAHFTKNNKPRDVLAEIKKNKIIRVGYNPNTMPFAFFNSNGKLVGYDVQTAHNLARDLECKIKFIPFDFSNMKKMLDNNSIDIAMSAIFVGADRIDDINFTIPYMYVNPAVIVKDFDRKKFADLDVIQDYSKFHDITIAFLKGSAYKDGISNVFPNAKLVEIENYKDFFENKINADMLVHSAEQGYTWTLLYPRYSVVILHQLKRKAIVAYAVAKENPAFVDYVNYWITIQKINKILDDNYKYWILGEVPELKKTRWCIAKDVLHWGVQKK